MSNDKVVERKKEKVVENADNGVATHQEVDPKQIIQDIMLQEKHHAEREDFHRTLRIKARGALEVLLQMHPQEETKQ